ncbi:hypothetical protein M1466_01645 [Candidatus Dependentiae bacterium]|nr:hypothetical protein [Candidatus Dependentiae bacterium]
MHYCNSANVIIHNNDNLIAYVIRHPTVSELTIKFAKNIPSAKRTAILNNSFAQLAEKKLTQQIAFLDLSGNQLTEPPLLTSLSNLRLLHLDNNQLIQSPVLTGLSVLRWLGLSENKLTEPPILTGLFALQGLNLSYNLLTKPPVLTGLSALQELALASNPLIKPPVLIGLSNLSRLTLDGNRLKEPLYIPLTLQGKLTVEGYTNVIIGHN